MSKMLTLSFAAALTSTLAWASLGLAQDTPKPKPLQNAPLRATTSTSAPS